MNENYDCACAHDQNERNTNPITKAIALLNHILKSWAKKRNIVQRSLRSAACPAKHEMTKLERLYLKAKNV